MKRRSFLSVSLLVIMAFRASFAQDYAWPTSASRHLSSSFGEFREGHFHSGIDIKTNHRSGYPAIAIADGYVWRVRTSPFGYGKALYLHLSDGNYAVYGHLDGFAAGIEEYVRAEQELRGRYSVDLYPASERFPVARGDTICYTGDTGTRHPHLHFEIRNPDGRPVDPLQMGYEIRDVTAPTIVELAVVPLHSSARVMGLPGSYLCKTERLSAERYSLPDPIIVEGPVGLEIRGYDSVRGLANKYGLRGIELWVDDSCAFTVLFDEFGFEETGLIDIERDYDLMARDLGRFHRLWRHPSPQPVPFYRGEYSGILTLEYGVHEIRIEATDANQNRSVLAFSLQANETVAHAVEYSAVADTAGILIVRSGVADPVPDYHLDWVDETGRFLSAVNFSHKRSTDGHDELLFSLLDMPGHWLRLSAPSRDNQFFRPRFLLVDQDYPADVTPPNISFRQGFRSFWCELAGENVLDPEAKFYVQQPEGIRALPVIPIHPTLARTEPSSLSFWESVIAVELRNSGGAIVWREPVRFTRLFPGREEQVWSADSLVAVTFGHQAAYDTILTWVRKESSSLPEFENMVSDVYEVAPQTQPLYRGAELLFGARDSMQLDRQVGIYAVGRKDLHFVGNAAAEGSRNRVAEKISLGRYCLARDQEPPLLWMIFPKGGSTHTAGQIRTLKMGIKDERSGIQDDSRIDTFLDGERIICEYHGVQDYLRYHLQESLKPGEHILELRATDNADNAATMQVRFMIDE